MSLQSIISIGIVGFAIAGVLYSLLSSLAKKDKKQMWQLALLSLFFCCYAIFSAWRRETPDPVIALKFTRYMDIFSVLFFSTILFVYKSISDKRLYKADWAIVVFYSLFLIGSLVCPSGFTWYYIDSMILQDLGIFGQAYFPHGLSSPFAFIFQICSVGMLIYCIYITIGSIKGNIFSHLMILLPAPILMIFTIILYMGNQRGWWNVPAMAEYFGFALYLVVGYSIFEKELNVLREKRSAEEHLKSLTTKLDDANRKLTLTNVELSGSEEKYRTLVEQSTDGLILVDELGNTCEWNQAQEYITGFTREEVINKPWIDIAIQCIKDDSNKPVIIARLQEIIKEILSTGQISNSNSHSFEVTLTRSDSTEKIVLQTVFSIPFKGAFRIGLIIRDITLQKLAQRKALEHQQQLIQADKMASLGLMVSGVAHEINNPNNLIMLNADLLAKIWSDMKPVLIEKSSNVPDCSFGGITGMRAIDKFSTMLNGISGASNRIATLVSNLKGFARIDNTTQFERVHIKDIVESAVMILSHHINKATNHFSVNLEPDLPQVMGNHQKLEQVLINLIVNACQSLESKEKSLDVEAFFDKKNGEVVLGVRDQGCGIPPEISKKIMDPFFTTKSDSGGTGLGLSVSYSIIKDHGGSITFKSEPDIGTVFEVRLAPVKQ